MGKALKIKQQAGIKVPQKIEEVVESIAEIGRRQRERIRIETQMNDELAAIRQKFEAEAAPEAAAIAALSKGVAVWCEANRQAITDNGKTKTVPLPSGEVRWRTCPPSVGLYGAEEVIKMLKKFGLNDMVRTKEEVNKEAILRNPDAVKGIKGITIKNKEEFVIVPFETKLEEVA